MRLRNISNKTALVLGEEKLTFLELTRLIETVAYNLQNEGVKAGQIIPVVLPRGFKPIVSLFALWRIGAVVTLIDNSYPSERIDYICSECKATFIINEKCYEKLSLKEKNLQVDDYTWQDFDPAMVIFTSGSTGNPKGVILPAGAINNAINNFAQFFIHEDEFLYIVPISFGILIDCLLAPLIMGVTVHIAIDSIRKDAKALTEYIERENISTTFLTTTLASAVLQLTSELRLIIVAAERVRNVFNDKTICVCGYGATETAAIVTTFVIDKPYNNTPIGKPLENISTYVLDENLQPVEEGELCVSGQIALGYLNLPELTKERFVKNPYSKCESDKILFRTNDIVRHLPSGELEYIERKDFMLKVRGMRVEPAEIETAIMNVAPVRAVVIGFEYNGDTILYAVYTSDKKIDPSFIRSKIKNKLVDYMIPSFIEQIDYLPLNANGKVDRTKIIPPDISQYQVEYQKPTNETEALICSVFEKVFKLEKIGINDDFISLGGSSITAVNVQVLLPFSVSATDILTLRTPKAIARVSPVSIPLSSDKKGYKISKLEQLWINLHKEDSQRFGLVVDYAFTLYGKLDVDRLNDSIKILLNRHRMLRAAYIVVDDENLRTYTDIHENSFEIIEKMEDIKQPFILSEGNLCRFFLLPVKSNENILWVSAFHGIIDGPSLQLLFEELSKIYLDLAEKSFAEICKNEIRPDAFDFFEWNKESLRYKAERAFYDEMFKDGIKINPLPWYAGGRALPNRIDTVVTHEFDSEVLANASKKLGVSVFAVIVSASARMIGEISGSNDVTLVLTMNNRYTYYDLVKTIGLYVDVVPIRLEIDKSTDFNSFVKRTDKKIAKIQSLLTYAGQDFLVENVNEADFYNSPLPNINFRQKINMKEFAGLNCEELPIPFEGDNERINACFLTFDQGDKIESVFKFPLDDCPQEVATKMNNTFVSLIEDFITDSLSK